MAGREKDLRYTKAVLAHELADPATLRTRLSQTRLDDATRARIVAMIDADCRA